MKLDIYKQALRYAGSRDWRTHRDIVHDAYVNYHRQTGKNLFDQDAPFVMRVIHLTLRTAFRNGYYMWRGNLYPKKYIRATANTEEDYDDYGNNWGSSYVPESAAYDATTMDVVATDKQVKRRLTPIQLFVYNKLKEGYTQLEISVERGGTAQAVHAKVIEIKKRFEELGIRVKTKQS